MDEKQTKRIEKIFPDYFDRFEMPAGAREENIKVYRACRSGKCDRDLFLPSFEENGFTLNPLADPTDRGSILYQHLRNLHMLKDLRALFLI